MLFFTNRRVVILFPPDDVWTFFRGKEGRCRWEIDEHYEVLDHLQMPWSTQSQWSKSLTKECKYSDRNSSDPFDDLSIVTIRWWGLQAERIRHIRRSKTTPTDRVCRSWMRYQMPTSQRKRLGVVIMSFWPTARVRSGLYLQPLRHHRIYQLGIAACV